MADVAGEQVYSAVFLRKQQNNTHLFAVDPGDGQVQYIEVPLQRARVNVGPEARAKWHNRPDQAYTFGERVNLRVERVE